MPSVPVLNPESFVFHVTADGSRSVLDTGASRSEIGSEPVPSLIKDLPPSVPSRVKELPSQVGFRFGNNQISHSQSQLHIPMHGLHGTVWVIVEVVPGSTPFLLSMKAMKCLGTQIDLEHSQVYLRRMQRPLAIYESRNGLLTVRFKDLCERPKRKECHLGQEVGCQPFHLKGNQRPSNS